MSILDRIASALLWIAAFALAAGIFLSATLLLRDLPPTEPVAIGLITILRYSKLGDYAAAVLFFILVPPLTIALRRVGERELARLRRFATPRTPPIALAILLTLPLLLSPIFFLTTGKIGWILLLPLVLAYVGPRALIAIDRRQWLRDLFRAELRPFHALLFAEGLSWILFRYLVTGRRIAHYPTLFLEVVFVAFFLLLFTAIAVLLARLASFAFGANADLALRRIAVAGLPLIALPFVALFVIPVHWPRTIVAAIAMLCALSGWLARRPMSSRAAWKLAAYAIFPALIYLVSYASTAQLSQWVDLFHRGETIGPASDYLRGKVPYRDVFALHGMLEDGLLDSWLMALFGRSLEVTILRSVVLGAFLGVSLWFLGIVLFDSIPLAMVVVAMGAWTTSENNRTFFQVAAVALFLNGLRGSRISMLCSGVFAGVALFFSYDIGLYTIVGGIAVFVILALARIFVAPASAGEDFRDASRKNLPPAEAGGSPRDARSPAEAGATKVLQFFAGIVIGTAPFAIYLAMRGALDDFLATSFVTIPRVIDAIWSLPFPDLVSMWRKDLNLHTLAEFVLLEKFHLILSPLAIAIAAVYCIQRGLRRRLDSLDVALLVLAVFATVAQRTAFGRAEFRHQYFAAFLIGPILVLLAILLIRALRTTWRDGDTGTRAFAAALAVAALPLMAVLFWIPDLMNARIGDLIGYHARVLRVTREPHAEEVRWRIEAVSAEIRRLAKPNQPIFDFSNQPAFYFFADRPNPTRFYQVPILSPREFQRETIDALEKAKPPVVIRTAPEGFDRFDGVPNAMRAQAVAAYLDDTYRFHKSIRGVELWTRTRNATAAPVERYLARIRLPAQRELAGQGVARIVFPAVGSIPGVNDSYWVSDLTLHNPFREQLQVNLRYVSGDVRLDRVLTLAPRQTMQWPDLVRTFFRAPSSIGTLWVWHPTGRAPVAVVKTYDAVHNGRASVETALTHRDAAAANTDNAELTIVGIPSMHEPGRRINVGVVNVGLIPATFRITARMRTGGVVGKAVESGVPEDEVWLVRDLEREIGITFDETTTIRITAIAGTGVGFATVIEPNGDNHFIAAVPAQPQ